MRCGNRRGHLLGDFRHWEFPAALRRAELRRIRFHDLRHTYTSLLIAHGVHPKYIQAQLGHASIQTTLDRYGQLMPQVASGGGAEAGSVGVPGSAGLAAGAPAPSGARRTAGAWQ
jgi:integrase